MTQVLKTKKLFYNKWPFKIECRLKGSNYIARIGSQRFIEWLDDPNGFHFLDVKKGHDAIALKKFATIFSQFEDKDIQVRGEGYHFSVFVKDEALLKELETKLKSWVYSITRPESDQELEFLISNSAKKTLCDRLPHEKYRYKVTLKENTPLETRSKFVDWLGKYDDRVRVSNSSKLWLYGEKMWVQAPFFYVETDKHLSMVLLYLGNHIRKTEEFILKTSINT